MRDECIIVYSRVGRYLIYYLQHTEEYQQRWNIHQTELGLHHCLLPNIPIINLPQTAVSYTAKSLHLCNRHDELSDLYQGGYHIWYCIVTCQIDCQIWYIMMAYSDSVCYLQSVPKQHYVPEQCNIMYQNNYQYVPDHLHTCNNVSFFIAHLTTTKSAV